MNAIKEFATFFVFIFKLTCCRFIDLKENTSTHSFQNHYKKRINYIPFLGFPLLGDEDVLQAKKFAHSPSIVYHPVP